MKLVVDTNAIAYLLLETAPFHLAVRDLFSGRHTLHAPSSWEVEYANVLWLAARAHVISPHAVGEKLRLAAGLGIEGTAVTDLWEAAVEIALSDDHPVYDTLFVELARRLRAPLVTYDQAVLRKFPDVARRPEQILAGA